MSYPQRVEWRFRNVYGDFRFYPTLDSIQISQEAPDVVATLSCTVVDGGEGWEFGVEDEVRVFCDDVRIFGGHLKVVTEDRADEFGPRMWHLEAQDYTAKLGDAIIRQRQHRKAESLTRRIRWIVSYLSNAWKLDGRDFKIPSDTAERTDYFGMTVAEALDNVANEEGLRYWVDADNILNVRKDEQSAAPFDLDNLAPDYVTSFPFREFTFRRDSSEIANAILVEPEKREDSRWSAAAGNIANYRWGDSTGRQELFISAEEIRTARGATRHGMAQLQRTKVADGEAHLVCFQPGIWAGMTVSLREALWDHDQSIRVIRVDISAVDPDDADGKAYMRCELTLSNKPKRRSPKLGRPEIETTVDTTPSTVDGFTRVVEPKTTEAGSALGVTLSPYYMRAGLTGTTVAEYATTLYGPTLAPGSGNIIAAAGVHNTGWVWTSCGVGLGAWSGWALGEQWYKLTVPEHPAGMAGIRVNVVLGWGYGVAGVQGVTVRASSTEPSAPGDGASIGHAPYNATTSILIPAGLVPAEGGELWVGLAPAWTPDYAAVTPWTCVTNGDRPARSGQYNSGYITGGVVGSATWEVLTGGDTDWGETDDGHTWQDGGTTGSPTAGMDGSSFYVSGEGGQGIYVEGDRTNDDEMTGAWSDTAWGVEVIFTASTLASGGSIVLTTTGQGSQTVGTIDLSATPGISVAAPTESDTATADIGADEIWHARFDSRAGELRGKVWKAGEPEPAEWTVITPMSETEDDADTFALWVYAATGQTARVLDVQSSPAARNGQQVLTEWLGHADGDTNRFLTNHRYRDGTLTPYVNGVAAPATRESGSTTEFWLDIAPTELSMIRASYIADTGEG